MTVRVCYLAQARKVAGVPEDVAPWQAGMTLPALLASLAEPRGNEFRHFLFREDGQLQPTLLITVNDQPVPRDSVAHLRLNEGDAVTIIPPIAGG